MKIADKKWFTLVLQWLITIAMVVGMLIILSLPFVLQWVLKYYENNEIINQKYYITCLYFLYPSGFLGFAVLYQTRKILQRVNDNLPFVFDNVKRIKNVARISAVLCIIYAIGLFFLNSFFVPILFVVFGLTALFTSVFGELFYKAVKFREENDLTI